MPTRPSPSSAAADPAFFKAGYAYETIRRKIIDGIYQPGDRLRLGVLALELDLSEMPVREALRLLQKDGLVLMHLQLGAEVAGLSFEHGRDVTEVRMTLERAAVLAALPHHDAASLAASRRQFRQLERSAGKAVPFAVKNRAFCTTLFAPCPNAFMRRQIEELWDHVWQASSTSVFAMMRQRVQATIDENRALLAHVRAADARRVRTILDLRMRNTLAAWDDAISQDRAAGTLATRRVLV